MSLLDAFLLEPTPLKTPTANAFHVALRTDGVLGSGTESDPWDGSTIRLAQGPASFAWSNHTEDILLWSYADPFVATVELLEVLDNWPDKATVTVTTPSAHGLVNGDVVRFGNVLPADAAAYFDHDLFIIKVNETQFTVTIPMPPFGVTPQAPMTVGRVEFRLDRVLRDLPTRAVLHIGGGTFETRGYQSGWADVHGNRFDSYFAKDGQRIIGSSVDVTVIKLVTAELPYFWQGYGAFGGPYYQVADGAELLDLTVDCNMEQDPWATPFSLLSRTAANFVGRFLRLQRVRAIHFGTHTDAAECFVITGPGTHPQAPNSIGGITDSASWNSRTRITLGKRRASALSGEMGPIQWDTLSATASSIVVTRVNTAATT